ncbi:HlyD family efflux transporter periplasmic adaptor subunit [Aporhodopirellula aestuarii]|uniref:HlyD family secretion protein n=1 Tax=Aporhodopirellula aestuarii TaxID=2950107 RepID=A0ABT0U4T7_9BACT|nr:HlyD family efflux transporter periplasmic adaptor subunit [Aporhodopirellula aestuarii]MCM2371822.1 HlyD family secretion protein [Aporhodopirellula aestuarii]
MTTTVASEPFLFTPGMSETSSGAAGGAPFRGGNPASTEGLVDQARQEISQIVREVAAAQRSDGGREKYMRFLADRVLRAMAAHGVVVWTAIDDSSNTVTTNDAGKPLYYRAEHRIGTITDHQFDPTAEAVHDCLLLEVAGQNSPVVVPPTPGASDADVPANPTKYPAAIVPILVDPAASLPNCLLEVFLEPGGSPASQRGSLRFLAQMGELAGEFLRADQLRTMTRRLRSLEECTQLIDQMGKLTSTRAIQAAWVDAVARVTNCPRVALCRVDRGRPQIVAVSHVDRIDQHSDAAAEIRRVAEVPLRRNKRFAFASIETNRRSGEDRRQSESASSGSATNKPAVMPRWLVAHHCESRWRLVLFEPIDQSRQQDEPNPEVSEVLERLLIGGNQAWLAANRIEAIPGGRWWTRLSATEEDESALALGSENTERKRSVYSAARRRSGLIAAIALTTTLLLCLPIPSMVPATGLIRPLELDTYHTVADATVETLHVYHGQTVQSGDMLATLVSRELTERKTTLLGRRAVLMQRRDQFNHALVASSSPTGGAAELQSDHEISEEIDAIDRQLELIAECEADLVLRARRDGRVDAWRLQERLAGRPLKRGDVVLSVIAEDTTWVVDATIPQRRVARVDHALAEENLTAEVSTRWAPGESQKATPHRFGPVVPDPVDGTPGVILRMTLSAAPQLGDQPLTETPARVAIHCGRTSLGWFLMEDIVSWCQTRVGIYL